MNIEFYISLIIQVLILAFFVGIYVAKVPAINRWLMFHSVDNWQKLCGWDD